MDSPSGSMLVAPCGMNCAICMAYLREKNKCAGCRGDDSGKPVTRVRCKIKTCPKLHARNAPFCSGCETFPCGNLRHLDERYRKKYQMSMIANLNEIESLGINAFLKNQQARWTCPKCGAAICVHKGYCIDCEKRMIK